MTDAGVWLVTGLGETRGNVVCFMCVCDGAV